MEPRSAVASYFVTCAACGDHCGHPFISHHCAWQAAVISLQSTIVDAGISHPDTLPVSQLEMRISAASKL
eukprot:1136717-Pelagomonas_calceolata.AAC.2